MFLRRFPLLAISVLVGLSAVATLRGQSDTVEIIVGPQRPPIPDCPSIHLKQPRMPIFDGEQAGFIVELDVDAKVVPTYAWSISAGTVIGGGGTRNLVIDTTGAASERGVEATVQIGGLPGICESTASIFLSVHPKLKCKFSVPALLKCYAQNENDDVKSTILRRLAASRDPRAAILLGNALDRVDSGQIRRAGFDGLLDYFLTYVTDGGTEDQYTHVHEWWLANRERLEKEAKALDDQFPKRYRTM